MLANIQEEPPPEKDAHGDEQNKKSPRDKGKIHKQKMVRPPKHGAQAPMGGDLGGFISVAGQKDQSQPQEAGAQRPAKSEKTIKLSDLMPDRQKHVADGSMSLFGVTSLEKPEEPPAPVSQRSAVQAPAAVPALEIIQPTGWNKMSLLMHIARHSAKDLTAFLDVIQEVFFYKLF